MQSTVSISGLDTLVLMVPFAIILAMGVLGLDGQIAAPKQNRRGRRYFCELGGNGVMDFPDPDGRSSILVPSRSCSKRDPLPASPELPRDSSRSFPPNCSSQIGLPRYRFRWSATVYAQGNRSKKMLT